MMNVSSILRAVVLRQAVPVQVPASVLMPSVMEFHTSCVVDRARRGTRERKRKVAVANKKKKEERLKKNPPPIPYKVELMLKSKGLWGTPKPIREVDKDKPIAVDNVFFAANFAYRRWTAEQALEELREMYHPNLQDRQDALVWAKVELDMRSTKKDRYLDEFSKTIPIIHHYDRGIPDRMVMAFCPTEEIKAAALEAGASKAGGEELITEVAKGRIEVADFDHFVCHEELSNALKPLSGLLRDKLPNIKDGTVGLDVPLLVKTFGRGMFVSVNKVQPTLGVADEPDYASCEVTIGRLDMDDEHIKENLEVLLTALNEHKPKRKDDSGLLTRIIFSVKPLEGQEEDPAGKFSVVHPLLDDPRIEEQAKVLVEGKASIAETVRQLRAIPQQ